jgi:hypothetical protein
VTAAQVLRKADIPAAGAALGAEMPPRPRTMADIRALHRPHWRSVRGLETCDLLVQHGLIRGDPGGSLHVA